MLYNICMTIFSFSASHKRSKHNVYTLRLYCFPFNLSTVRFILRFTGTIKLFILSTVILSSSDI